VIATIYIINHGVIPVFTPLCCMFSVEPVNTNFIVFSLIRTHDLPHSVQYARCQYIKVRTSPLSNNLSLSETGKLCEYYVSPFLSQGVKSVISYIWYLLFSSDFFLPLPINVNLICNIVNLFFNK
jgi:hypothetical protein